jgi:hypothetical protein
MRKQILAATTVIALAIAAVTSAMAFDHKAGHAGRHVKAHHAAGMHGYAAKRNRLAGARNPGRWHQGNDRGGFIDLGPLGFTAACGSPSYKGRYCGQGYSVSGWTY